MNVFFKLHLVHVDADLIEVHAEALLVVNLSHAEEAYRLASSLQLLLQHFPADMSPDSRQALLNHFAVAFARLNDFRYIYVSELAASHQQRCC